MLIIVINGPLLPLNNLDITHALDPTARKCGPGLPKPDLLAADPEEKWFSNPLSTKEN
jgi:hypothetical protein